MGRSNAYLRIHCDIPGCEEYTEYELTSLAGRGWDDRNITKERLEKDGWIVD